VAPARPSFHAVGDIGSVEKGRENACNRLMHVLGVTAYTCGEIFAIHSFCLNSAEKINLTPLFEFRGRKPKRHAPGAERF
jgi:hypothetical protein